VVDVGDGDWLVCVSLAMVDGLRRTPTRWRALAYEGGGRGDLRQRNAGGNRSRVRSGVAAKWSGSTMRRRIRATLPQRCALAVDKGNGTRGVAPVRTVVVIRSNGNRTRRRAQLAWHPGVRRIGETLRWPWAISKCCWAQCYSAGLDGRRAWACLILLNIPNGFSNIQSSLKFLIQI
jgi:hypothetical protein